MIYKNTDYSLQKAPINALTDKEWLDKVNQANREQRQKLADEMEVLLNKICNEHDKDCENCS